MSGVLLRDGTVGGPPLVTNTIGIDPRLPICENSRWAADCLMRCAAQGAQYPQYGVTA
jgi:hypothetical protein